MKIMNTILVLVDFDNYASLNDVPGQKVKMHHVESCIEQLKNYLLEWCDTKSICHAEFNIRLYGGWYSDETTNSKTELRNMIDLIIKSMSKRHKKFRFNFQSVDSIIASPDIQLTNTFRNEQISININNNILDKCTNKSSCKTRIVNEWQKDGCPNCKVPHTDLLTKKLQKAVDTSISVDMVTSCNNSYSYIILVSADYDMIPCVLYAIKCKQKIVLFRKKESIWYDIFIGDCEIVSGIQPSYRGVK